MRCNACINSVNAKEANGICATKQKRTSGKWPIYGDHGRHTELRAGVCVLFVFLFRCGGLEGVAGRRSEESGSARLMNCKGVKGDPLVEGDDLMDCGLCPLGVKREKDGTKGTFGSGVRGGSGGVLIA
jgi:hypothetical protein